MAGQVHITGSSGAADGAPQTPLQSVPHAHRLEQEILDTLRREARAAAVCLWERVEEGMRLDTAIPTDLPRGEVIPDPGGLIGEAAAAGAMQLLGEPHGTQLVSGIPLVQERLQTRAAALLPLSETGQPAQLLITLHWPRLPAGAEESLFTWSRWARLLALVHSPGAVPPGSGTAPRSAGHPGAWPAEGESLQRAAGSLACRMHERLSSVLPSLHRAIGLTGDDDPSLRFLRHTAEGLDRTFHLLTRLAAFAGDAPLLAETMSVADCAAEAVRRLEPERPAGVRLTARIPPDLPAIVADRVQITAALMEVTRNALEAAPDSTVVELVLTAEDDGIAITVQDEGAGMGADVLARAVTPFFSTRHPSRHAGLGLSTVQGCVDRHGGSLALSSGPGEGTRVRIWFPASVRSPAD